jgi:hypothetical protein
MFVQERIVEASAMPASKASFTYKRAGQLRMKAALRKISADEYHTITVILPVVNLALSTAGGLARYQQVSGQAFPSASLVRGGSSLGTEAGGRAWLA